jgi:hypothetical protein
MMDFLRGLFRVLRPIVLTCIAVTFFGCGYLSRFVDEQGILWHHIKCKTADGTVVLDAVVDPRKIAHVGNGGEDSVFTDRAGISWELLSSQALGVACYVRFDEGENVTVTPPAACIAPLGGSKFETAPGVSCVPPPSVPG